MYLSRIYMLKKFRSYSLFTRLMLVLLPLYVAVSVVTLNLDVPHLGYASNLLYVLKLGVNLLPAVGVVGGFIYIGFGILQLFNKSTSKKAGSKILKGVGWVLISFLLFMIVNILMAIFSLGPGTIGGPRPFRGIQLEY